MVGMVVIGFSGRDATPRSTRTRSTRSPTSCATATTRRASPVGYYRMFVDLREQVHLACRRGMRPHVPAGHRPRRQDRQEIRRGRKLEAQADRDEAGRKELTTNRCKPRSTVGAPAVRAATCPMTTAPSTPTSRTATQGAAAQTSAVSSSFDDDGSLPDLAQKPIKSLAEDFKSHLRCSTADDSQAPHRGQMPRASTSSRAARRSRRTFRLKTKRAPGQVHDQSCSR